mmetsp:Transcript_23274/g.59480  ORF Transcript_23274/g.59480 Transcript_23274/m.59480 type:complete len:226 (+) Transcript_23274:280-957(+)
MPRSMRLAQPTSLHPKPATPDPLNAHGPPWTPAPHFLRLLLAVFLRSLGLCFQLASRYAAPLLLASAACVAFCACHVSFPYSGAKGSSAAGSTTAFFFFLGFSRCIISSSRRMGLVARPRPPLGLGSENLVPRSTCFLRTPYTSAPSGPTDTSTRSTVMLPQRGQNRRPTSLVTKKQAEQRSAQRLRRVTWRPSRDTRRSPICSSTFCIAKSAVTHTTLEVVLNV